MFEFDVKQAIMCMQITLESFPETNQYYAIMA